MYTIPPAGMHPTMPPPPAHRSKRALGFALAGLALLVGAIAASRSARPESAAVFVGQNDTELASALARVLFGASGASQFASILYAVLSFQRAKVTSALALLVALVWVGVVVFWVRQSV